MRRRVSQAHRVELLERATAINVRFSSGGLAFRTKGQGAALLRARATLTPARQQITVAGQTPAPWSVTIADSQDLKCRLAALHAGLRLFRWTTDDIGAFAAGAFWTYVMMPLLLRDATRVRVRRSGPEGDEVELHLDGSIAGHGPDHVLYVDRAGRIVRHDYTATGFGRWARAAQTITGYAPGTTVPFGAVRRVTPRLGRRRLPGPTLVWIRVHDIALEHG